MVKILCFILCDFYHNKKFKNFKLKYTWFTISCQFQVYNTVIQLYLYIDMYIIFLFQIFSLISYYKTLTRAPHGTYFLKSTFIFLLTVAIPITCRYSCQRFLLPLYVKSVDHYEDFLDSQFFLFSHDVCVCVCVRLAVLIFNLLEVFLDLETGCKNVRYSEQGRVRNYSLPAGQEASTLYF